MTERTPRVHARLAAYAAAASAAPTATADIQLYEGPPIGIGFGDTTLELGDLSLSLQATIISYRNIDDYVWSDCCGFSKGGWCTYYGAVGSTVYRGFYSLYLVCNASMESMQTVGLGQAVQGTGQCGGWYPQPLCSFSYQTRFDCGDTSYSGFGNCSNTRRFHVRFSTDRDGQPIFGWIEFEHRGWDNVTVNRWAYEDSGSPILVGQVPPPPCPGDLDGNRLVDSSDLGLMIAAWGSCQPKTDCAADLDQDGAVTASDLGYLIAAWGPCSNGECDTTCDDDIECTLDGCVEGSCYNQPLYVGACELGSCCEANGTPGCSDPACQTIMCQTIPDCCDIAWDSGCATMAEILCSSGTCP